MMSKLIEEAASAFDAWYESEPVPGEEDSLSHEWVREYGLALIACAREAVVSSGRRL